jgi:hypothetical protein
MLDGGLDQAAGLRAQAAPDGLALLALPVEPGEGVSWVVQLARALRTSGTRPVVLDAVGDGMLTRAFGLGQPRRDLLDMLSGGQGFDAVAHSTADGIHVLRAERGVEAFVASGAAPHRLLAGFARLSHGFDALLLVMPPAELACLAAPARTVPVVVLQAGDRHLMGAYATVKQLAEGFGYRRFSVVTQGHADAATAREAHERFAMAAQHFLDVEANHAGSLPALRVPDPAQRATLAASVLALASRFPRSGSPD